MSVAGMTLPEILERAANLWPDNDAWIFDHTQQRFTFADVRDHVVVWSAYLVRNGVRPGDRVAVMLDNRPEFPLAWLALGHLGAVLVPVNTNYQEADASHVIRHSAARLVVTSQRFLPLLNRLSLGTSVEAIVSVDDRDAVYDGDSAGCPAAVAQGQVEPRQAVNIQYTSGTTGKPKGCVIPHDYWTTLAASLVDAHPFVTEHDRLLTAQPFSYIDPQWHVALGLAAGARLTVLDRFHPSTFWSQIRDHEVTWFYCLGAMPALLLQMPASEQDRANSVRAIHCSAIPSSLHAALQERWGVPWYEAFGMTETGADLRMEPEDQQATMGTGCMGRPLAHRQAVVVTPDGHEAEPRVVGELRLRGDGMMLGYHRDEPATRHAFVDGWFKTGDLAWQDSIGRLYHAGRIKDTIRRSGENIAAVEVEEVIMKHPDVNLAAVVAVPDELRGEEVRAFVTLTDNRLPSEQDPQDLAEFTRRQLAYFKVPRYWTFRQHLPMTASERVAKADLRNDTPLGPNTYDHLHGRWLDTPPQ